MIEFKLLGRLEVLDNRVRCTPSAPKLRQVLAILLMRADQVVPTGSLLEELWGDKPPASAATTMQTYIYKLRKLLEKDTRPGCESALVTRMPGYALRIDPGQLDLHSFTQLAAQGCELLKVGRAEAAADRLREALALWRGGLLENVHQGTLLQAHVAALQEQWMKVLELRIRADMALSRHSDLIGELRTLVAAHPFNEWLHGQLIVALNASGRRGEALLAFQNARRILHDQLGLDPGADLRRIQHLVLNGGVPARAGEPLLLPG